MGAGTITEQRAGYFQVRVRVGTDEAGRPVIAQRAGRATRADAERWLQEMMPQPAVGNVDAATTIALVRVSPQSGETLTRTVRRRRARPSEARPFNVDPLLHDRGGDVSVLARAVGVDRRIIYRAKLSGLTIDQADAWAMACGLHPLEVWGDAWLADVACA